MKRFLYPFLLIAIAIGLIWVFRHKDPEPKYTITVSDPKAIAWAPFAIALEKGFFAEEGLKVSVVAVQTGDESIKALLSGSVDVALAGVIPYSFAALNNPDIKIFAQNAYAHDNHLIARRDKGIEKPEDLKGKKIGYTPTTASDIGVEKFLKEYGIDKSEVKLVSLKPLAMPTALASGQIDAYSSWEPHILNGQKALGSNAIVFDDSKSTYTWHGGLIAKGNYISIHQKELKAFVSAWKKSEKYIKENPDESIAIEAKYTNIPAGSLKQIWHKYDLNVGITEDTYDILNTDLLWANAHRETPVPVVPKANELIDTTIVAK